MAACFGCPRRCDIDRLLGQKGYCDCGPIPRVARVGLHFWEEPCISGTRGSGTVFFSGCNMRCLFCQNSDISIKQKGELYDAKRLTELFLYLQSKSAHNINLVTPTPHIPVIAAAIRLARQKGLHIPIVYNTNGYESLHSLRFLNGLVDIYLPDFKYVSPALSARYSDTPEYFSFAAEALLEMHRQVGLLSAESGDIATRGLLVRHMVLPGSPEDTRRVMDFLWDNLPKETSISLMRQYTPAKEGLPSPLNRRLTDREYDRAIDYCLQKGFVNVLIQYKESASSNFIPAFFDVLKLS